MFSKKVIPIFLPFICFTLANKCHDNWLFYMDKCYLFTVQNMTFDEGKHFCNELDSHLIQLDTKLKNEFIVGQVKQDSWIGSSSEEQYQYLWVATKRKVTDFFTNWQELEPSCSKCCVKIKVEKNFKWFTDSCNKINSVICERNSHFSSKFLKKTKQKKKFS